MNQTLRALNGFGLGARPGQPSRLGDPKAWLRTQLEGPPPRLDSPVNASGEAIAGALRAFRDRRRGSDTDREQARRGLFEIAAAESRAVLAERVSTSRPFVERLVAFWSNHLCVSAAGKVLVAPLAGSYEREVIRPHVLGRFEDMVLASARHPAMLVYLDGFQSIGPSSTAARRTARATGTPRGLNENYARELLELHTLGVDGGYTQHDVRELAKVLTGWTVDGIAPQNQRAQPPSRLGAPRRSRTPRDASATADGPLRFAFRENWHEPGTKTVLGVSYAGGGATEGERAIRALCRHPATATFVATKLARHFVADDPPRACVNRLAASFRETGGDLRILARVLVDSPEPWEKGARKFRTPQDWLVAAMRALDAPAPGEQVVGVLRQLRHPLWAPPSPKGFGDSMHEWADADSLLNRAELARTTGRRWGRATDPLGLVDVIDLAPDDPLHATLSDTSVPVAERLALAIAGPAFQWR